MTKIFCDRCKREIKNGGAHIRIDTESDWIKQEDKDVDLCPACFYGLRQFLDGWEITTDGKLHF